VWQPLVIDVELDVPTAGSHRLSETLNYETILEAARAIAAGGHIELVETFAERLAHACLADPRVTSGPRVRVKSRSRLAPDAVAAGVRSQSSATESLRKLIWRGPDGGIIGISRRLLR